MMIGGLPHQEMKKNAPYRLKKCVLHHGNPNYSAHWTAQCDEFRAMPDAEKQRAINDLQLCVRCLESHPNKACWSNFICFICRATSHCTAAHMNSVLKDPGHNNSDGNKAFGNENGNRELERTPALRTGSESYERRLMLAKEGLMLALSVVRMGTLPISVQVFRKTRWGGGGLLH